MTIFKGVPGSDPSDMNPFVLNSLNTHKETSKLNVHRLTKISGSVAIC